MEFAEASNAGLPRLVFLLDEFLTDAPAGVVDAEPAAIEAFRAGLLRATFRSGDGLELAAYQALIELAGADARVVPRRAT